MTQLTIIAMTNFFFSSRRRHTRCLSDWSSDVCSSDLLPGNIAPCFTRHQQSRPRQFFRLSPTAEHREVAEFLLLFGRQQSAGQIGEERSRRNAIDRDIKWPRSEERRVGKECRSRWSTY